MRSEEDALEAEIRRLEALGLDELRKLCGPVLGAVPVNHGAHLLRRRLAYELQARALGDLPAETHRRLRRLCQSFKTDPQHKPMPRRPLKPGLVLTRNWQGVLHQVQVTDQGFDYRGERFASLSEVARRITGTRWSGPLFFGLKKAGS
ncbi:MAG: DUF2924 domain-containing protein [Proteobacteria bacterium]|nr:DUF2924 domain-containing protein [Pseudomonadota bacterium]